MLEIVVSGCHTGDRPLSALVDCQDPNQNPRCEFAFWFKSHFKEMHPERDQAVRYQPRGMGGFELRAVL